MVGRLRLFATEEIGLDTRPPSFGNQMGSVAAHGLWKVPCRGLPRSQENAAEGYLVHKKTPAKDLTVGLSLGVLGGWAFTYGRDTPVLTSCQAFAEERT